MALAAFGFEYCEIIFTEVVRLFSEHRIKPEGQPGVVSAVIR
jgi:hypothetical protein